MTICKNCEHFLVCKYANKPPIECIHFRDIRKFIPMDWLTEKLVGHPEISYRTTDSIITVLYLWNERRAENGKTD